MEDKYPIKEIKVMEGVYIWKPETKPEKNSQNNNTNLSQNVNNNLSGKKTTIGENNYLCHGTDELVRIYEIEFEEIGNKIQSLFQSNEDMMEFDPHDYDLIQAREENLELIDKKMEEMIIIQKKMKDICSYHPIVNVDIFEYFGIGKKTINENKEKNINSIEKKEKENLENEEDNKNGDNINSINAFEDNKEKKENNSINQESKYENNKDIITEIEL